jgi:hypothetical protein
MAKEELKINKLVGIKDGEIYVLRECFKYSDGFKGCTGYSMRPLTQEEIDQANDSSYSDLEYIWRESVSSGRTLQGYEEWFEDAAEEAHNSGRYFPFDDPSYRDDFDSIIRNVSSDHCRKIIEHFGTRVTLDDGYLDELYLIEDEADFDDFGEPTPEYEDRLLQYEDMEHYVDWTCGGCGRCFSKNMKFDYVFNQDCVDLINQYEEKED